MLERSRKEPAKAKDDEEGPPRAEAAVAEDAGGAEPKKSKKKKEKKKKKDAGAGLVSAAEYDKMREEFASFITESEAVEKEYEAKVATLEKKVEALKSGMDMTEYEGEALLEELESVEQRAIKAEAEVAAANRRVRQLEEQARQRAGEGADAKALAKYKEENQKLRKKVKLLRKDGGNSWMEAKVRRRRGAQSVVPPPAWYPTVLTRFARPLPKKAGEGQADGGRAHRRPHTAQGTDPRPTPPDGVRGGRSPPPRVAPVAVRRR